MKRLFEAIAMVCCLVLTGVVIAPGAKIADLNGSLPLVALLGLLTLSMALALRMYEQRLQWRPLSNKFLGFLLCAALSLLIAPSSLMAQAGGVITPAGPVPLGTSSTFLALAQAGVSFTGGGTVTGNIGLCPYVAANYVTGTPAVTVIGLQPPGDNALACTAEADLATAYNYAAAAARGVPTTISGDVGGDTFTPGLFASTSTLGITGNLTLDAGGNGHAVWIFQIASALTTLSGSNIILKNGANAANIFWQVGSSATLGTNSTFAGTILAATSITETTGAKLTGRALAGAVNPSGAVTIDTGCAGVVVCTTSAIPTSPPTVISTVPTPSGVLGVLTNTPITATFNEAMDCSTIATATAPLTFTLQNVSLGTSVAGTATCLGATATFTPTTLPLAFSTTYTATITTAAMDPAGFALASPAVWTFTTAAAPDLPPTVISTVPATAVPFTTGVAIGNPLSATFNKAMLAATIVGGNFTLNLGSPPVLGALVGGAVSFDGAETATFRPTFILAANTTYTATITTGVTDLAGTPLASNYVWSFTTDVAPTVISTVPAPGATSVAIGSPLTATFSKVMLASTITPPGTFILQTGIPLAGVAGTVTYPVGGLTATFTPSSSLVPNTLYTATITTVATDLAGTPLAVNHTWSFTTDVAPTVSFTVPTTTVPFTTNVPIGNALSATFSKAMLASTIIAGRFTLNLGSPPVLGALIPGAVSFDGVQTATFKPTSILAANTTYTATITTGVTDSLGTPLASNYVWSFTTGATPDTTPPTVSSTVPASGAINVPIGNALSATFSKPMNPTTITTASFTLVQGSTPVSGAVTFIGVTATFKPLSTLAPNALFTATITTGVTDLAGNHLASNYVWTFTTGATPDTTPPTVISTVPASGATNVPVGNALAATFSKAMNPLTITTATFILQQGTTAVSGTVSYVGVIATFTPVQTLAANTLFTATINTGVTDLAGNALVSNYTWTFTTGATPDTTPPTVISTVPANGATLVTTTANIGATFSKAINPLTITTATFLLQQGTTGTTQIPGTVTYAGTSATFRPTVSLTPNTTYSATITSGVADLSGNFLAANYLWSFTTGSAIGQTPICLANFAVLAGSAVIGDGSSIVTGDIGVSPGTSVTGFPPGTLSGMVHAGDATAAQAIIGFNAAYTDAVSRATGPVSVSGDLGAQTFTAGLYRSAASLQISSGNLTLDAKGDANAVFIFQIGSTLTTASGNQIILVNGAQAFNVFWQVGTSATLGAGSILNGSILANQSITVGTAAVVNGRLEALNGTITLQSSFVTSPPPVIALGGILNAADVAQTVAAGSIASIFGNNIGSSFSTPAGYPLPTTLGGSNFTIGSYGAPLYMTSCSQANLQIPWETAGLTLPPVIATTGDLISAAQPLNLVPYAPGIFALNMMGSGQGAVQIANTSTLAAAAGPGSNPVPRGGYISIFCTGLGPVTNQPATGAGASSNPLSQTLALPTLTIGGAPAQVTFSGLAPGFAGLYQVNAIVPASVTPGSALAIVLSIGGVSSNTVTIAVQ